MSNPAKSSEAERVDLSGFYTDTHNGSRETARVSASEVATVAAETWRQPAAAYAYREVVAVGGMGAVLRMWDPRVERDVAMKVLLPPVVPRRVERFWREARLTAALSHPNIVAVHELGLTPLEEPYFTMKLVEGEGLHRLIEQWSAAPAGERPSLAARMRVGRRVCDAIGYAHQRGVHHLDVKPQNVLVGAFGEVIVIDWGVAQIADDPEELGERPSGAVIGTPGFMAPEQAAGQTEQVSAQTDVYALGALFYALATLKPPLVGDSLEQLLAHNRDGRVVPPHQRGDCPLALSRIIMRAMSKEPSDRYDDVGELLADVEAWLDGRAPIAARLGVLEKAALFVRRHRGVARGLVAATIIGVVLAAAAVVRIQNEYQRANAGESAAQSAAALARQQLANAETARESADRARALAERAAYAAEIRFAQQALRQGRRRAAATALSECAESRRDWAWRWLRHGVDAHRVVELTTGPPTAAAVLDSRACALTGREIVVWTDGEIRKQPLQHPYQHIVDGGRDEPAILFNESGEIGLYDVASGKKIWATSAAPQGITAAIAVGDGQHLLLAENQSLNLFDVTANRVVKRFQPGLGRLLSLVSTGDGRQFLLGGERSEVAVWDLRSGSIRRRYQLAGRAARQLLDHAGRRLVVIDDAGVAAIVDLGSGDFTRLSVDGVATMALSADGSLLALGLRDGSCEVWSLAELKVVARLQVSGNQGILGVGWHAGEVLVVDGDGLLGRWQLPDWPRLLPGVLPSDSPVQAAIAASGRMIVWAGQRILVYDPAAPTEYRQLSLPTAVIAAYSHAKEAIVVTADGAILRVAYQTAAVTPAVQLPRAVVEGIIAEDGSGFLWRDSQGTWTITELAGERTSVVAVRLAGWRPLRLTGDGFLVAQSQAGTIAAGTLRSDFAPRWEVAIAGRVAAVKISEEAVSLLIRDDADQTALLMHLDRQSGERLSTMPLSAGGASLRTIGFTQEGVMVIDDEGLLIVADAVGNQLVALELRRLTQPQFLAAGHRTIVATDEDGNLEVWHVPDSQL